MTKHKGKNGNTTGPRLNGDRVGNEVIQIRPGLYTVVHSNSIFVERESELPSSPVTINPLVGQLEPA